MLAATATFSSLAQAQEFKLGFVNTERIFREAATAKQAQAKLEQEFSRREKELVDAGNALKLASEKFEREAPTLAESQRTARQKQLLEQDREFQRKRREFQEDLNVAPASPTWSATVPSRCSWSTRSARSASTSPATRIAG